MAASLGLVLLLARLVKVENRLAVLLAVGSAVCGNTAIVATAPVIGARPREVAYAVATITLFGTLAVLLYPTIGHLVGLPQALVRPVGRRRRPRHEPGHRGRRRLRTGGARRRDGRQAHPQRADGAAADPHRLGLGDVRRRGRSDGPAQQPSLRRAFPLFVLGFLALAALRSIGVIGPEVAAAFDTVARAFVLVALAGVGVSTRFRELRETSWRPLAIGLGVAVIVGLGSLAAISALGLGAGLT